MQAIINNCEALQMTMETSSHGTDDCSRRAAGVLALMDKFSTYFGLKLSVFIFSIIIEQLSTTLQGRNTNVGDRFMAVNLCIKTLERHRTDSTFHSFYQDFENEASEVCDAAVLPRKRKIPRRLDEGSSEHVFSSVEASFRKDYFEALDCVKGELEKRFHQENFMFIRMIE